MASWAQREHARQVLSTEVGFVRKPHGDRLRVALVFPNTYWIGMSSLGFQAAYSLFNAEDDVVCERCFLPPRTEFVVPGEKGAAIVSLESQTALDEFDVIAFSVSFERDYPHILTILRIAGIPLYAAERSSQPLVVVGGAVTFLNPEPLAPFADVIAAGEGEVLVPAFVRSFRSASSRSDLLKRLAAEGGFYVPAFYEPEYGPDGRLAGYVPREQAPLPVRRASLRAADAANPPATTVFTPHTEFGSRLLVEIVRGCANLCRFCWAGYNYLPVRPFPADRILELAAAARPHASGVGLVSIALCDHPEIQRILARLIELGYSISPASLRLDDLTEPIVRLLRQGGERTVTIAPEAGSDRLRRVINKTITNDEIIERAEVILSNGIESLKLYFMIGLPSETDEDLVAIRTLTLRLRDVMLKYARPRGQLGRIVGSVNPLIPKPATAFQWLPMEDPATIEKKTSRLRTLMSGLDNISFTMKSERHSYYQALLSLGDRRVARVIESAERHSGNWRAGVRDSGVDPDFYVFRDRRQDLVLPWDIIDTGVKTSFLETEISKALRAEQTVPASKRLRAR
jgi:radical SAM superfamily enzyme YgiQ (UPF0313 family)